MRNEKFYLYPSKPIYITNVAHPLHTEKNKNLPNNNENNTQSN